MLANLILVTGDRGAAEDALQEALARAWARGEHEGELRSVEAWVGIVALNLARGWLRRLGSERRARARLEARSVAGEVDPDREISTAAVRAAIRDLPRRQREVVYLCYYLDLGVAAAARALGVNVGTVKKALHRARATLATKLAIEEVSPRDAYDR